MNILFSLIPLAALFILLAVALKLGALLMRRTRVTWRHAFVYAVAVGLIAMAARGLIAVAGWQVSLLAGLVPALLLQVAFGAWYLSPRATTSAGFPLGYRGAALLSVVTWGVLGAVSAGLVGLGRLAGPVGG